MKYNYDKQAIYDDEISSLNQKRKSENEKHKEKTEEVMDSSPRLRKRVKFSFMKSPAKSNISNTKTGNIFLNEAGEMKMNFLSNENTFLSKSERTGNLKQIRQKGNTLIFIANLRFKFTKH